MNSVWDISRGDINRGYGHLPADKLEDWALNQIKLSLSYHVEKAIPGASSSNSGLAAKAAMVDRVRKALTKRSNLSPEDINRRVKEVGQRLEDPGLLENFEYFDIPSSDFMLNFYFAVWDRRIAEVMDFTHNYGKDLKGVFRKIPEDDVWYQMSLFEGMNINERKKAQDIVSFIWDNHIQYATSLGGGNVPERLYDLPDDLQLAVFDNGPVSPLEELFPDVKERTRISYYHEPLLDAVKYPKLIGTQDLVWGHGISMYMPMEEVILAAEKLLRSGGYLKYDYLMRTASITRVVATQGWPFDPANPMLIFESVDAAIAKGLETLAIVNDKLEGKVYMDALDPKVTIAEPWGPTSVRFTVVKHT